MLQRVCLMMQERWFDILIGFTIPIFLGMVKLAVEQLLVLSEKRKVGFAIEGMWCSVHRNFRDQYLVEFMKIKYIKKNRFQIFIKQIRDNNMICRYVGNGIKSNNQVYILYESIEKNDGRAGTFMLQLKNQSGKGDYLTGKYFEYEEEMRDKRVKKYPINSYAIFPMSSSNILLRLSNLLTVKRVKKYEEAQKIAERCKK